MKSNNMTQDRFDRLFEWIRRNRFLLLILFFLLTAAAFFRLTQVTYQNDVAVMLPKSPAIGQTLHFIQTSDMSDTIAFSIRLKDPKGRDLLEQVDLFAAQLKNQPQIIKVVTGMEHLDMDLIRSQMVQHLPQLLAPDPERFKETQTDEAVARKIQQVFLMLTTPGSSMMQATLAKDPFGWSNPVMDRMLGLSRSLGFNVKIRELHFVDPTGEYALVLAKTNVPVTDADGSEQLLGAIKKIVAAQEQLEIETICGHRHTLSNQQIIKKDILVTSVIITLAFTVLMIFMFRSADAASIFILPFFAIVLSVLVSTFIFDSLSYFMIGFAAVIAGFSVDYGIHLYAAWKIDGYQKFKATIRPVMIASLSTTGVFVSLFGSSVEGYRELAIFSILSILICVVLSILFLPHFWKGSGTLKKFGISFELPASYSRWVICGWAVVIAVSLACIWNTSFTQATDISKFDGSDKSVFEAEKRFYQVWGGEKRPGVIVTEVDDLEIGWQVYEALSRKMQNKVKGFNSLALLLPSSDNQKKNRDAWKAFWTQARTSDVKERVAKAAASFGFQPDAFDAFLTLLNAEDTDEDAFSIKAFEIFGPNFVQKSDGRYRLLSYFEDSDENIRTVEGLLPDAGHSYMVSRTRLSNIIGTHLMADMRVIGVIAAVWIIGLIIIFLRRPVPVFLAFVPVVTAIGMVFLVLTLFRMEVTAIVLITLVIILGLSLDYGVFISSAATPEQRHSVVMAATFSCMTTVMGAGALLFARHPVMFTIGVTLVSGVLAAYLSAVFCIPAFQKVFK